MSSTTQKFGCTEAMDTFHRVLDGDLMDAVDRTRMDSHLAVCSDCAEKTAQLREMVDQLRGIAESPLPDEALRRVRERTLEASPEGRTRRGLDWRFVAAAAMVVFATWIGANWYPRQPEPDRVALRAAQEARLVLRLTANALKRTEQVALKEVFADAISPALRKIGVRFPQTSRRSEDEGVEL